MSITTYASRSLAAQILQTHNYKCALLPVLDTAGKATVDEFAVRVAAEDPAFTWGAKQDGGERFPVGFMYAKLRDGSYVLFTNENESAVELAERVSRLATAYLEREDLTPIALSA